MSPISFIRSMAVSILAALAVVAVAPSGTLAAPSGNRAHVGFADATVNNYGSGDSWVGSYALTDPDGNTVIGYCTDHGEPYPKETVAPVADPEGISDAARGQLSYLLWAYGSTDDPVTAAAVSLLVHDYTAVSEGGTSNWELDVATMTLGGGFGGQASDVKARAIALKAEAVQLQAPWTLEIDSAAMGLASATVTGHVVSASGNPVSGQFIEIFGGTQTLAQSTAADGTFTGEVNVVDNTTPTTFFVNTNGPSTYQAWHGGGDSQRVLSGAGGLLQAQATTEITLAQANIAKTTTNPAWQDGEGAVFEIRFDTTGDGTYDTVVDTLTITAGDNTSDPIPPGTYQIVETVAPAGQTLMDPIVVTIEAGDTYQIDAVNEVIETGRILFTKTDPAGDPLSGGFFEVSFDSDGDGTYETLVAELAAGDDGTWEVTDLALGRYQIIERAAPDGFALDSTPIIVNVDWDPANPTEVTAANNGLVGYRFAKSLTGHNPDHYRVAGVVIEVVDESGTPVEGATCEIGVNGDCVIPNVLEESVTYCWRETDGPEGVVLDTEGACFTAAGGGATIDIVNDASTMSVAVIKTDGEDVTVPVPGASFDLCRLGTSFDNWVMPAVPADAVASYVTSEGDCVWVDSGVTDDTGSIDFADQPAGDSLRYCLIETSAPDGWVLDSTPVCFDSVDAGEPVVFDLAVAEQRVTANIRLSKVSTGLVAGLPIQGARYAVYAPADLPAGYLDAASLGLGAVGTVPDLDGYTAVGIGVTSATGLLGLAEVPAVTWCFIEIEAPAGFVIDTDPVCVDGADADPITRTMEAIATNDRDILRIDICKYDTADDADIACTTGDRLTGAGFEVWLNPTSSLPGLPVLPATAFTEPEEAEAGSELAEARAGLAGYLLWSPVVVPGGDDTEDVNVPWGYETCVIETTAPDDFVVDPTPVCIDLDNPEILAGFTGVRLGNDQVCEYDSTKLASDADCVEEAAVCQYDSSLAATDADCVPPASPSNTNATPTTTTSTSETTQTSALAVTGIESRILLFAAALLVTAGWAALEVTHHQRRPQLV